jgi:maleate isomerase
VAVPKTESRGRSSILPWAVPLEPIGARGRIGLLALATDVNSERDLHRMAPAGVEIFTNRIANANPVTMASHRAMAGDIARAARGLLPGNRIDVVAFGCTTATAALGEEKIAEAIRAGRPDLPCTNPITATLVALAAFDARRISMLTPYTAPVNVELAAYLEDQGVEVLNIAGFDLDRDDDMTAVPPAALLAAGLQVCDPRADVLFVSCTAMRTTDVLDEFERRLGKPVVASNQALLWHSLRLIGHLDPLAGFGRLFARPLPI